MLEPTMKSWRYAQLAHILIGICGLAYLILSFLTPLAADSTRFSASRLQLLAIQLSVIIPIFIIWVVAGRGAIAFKRYAQLINKSAEATAINQIADGLLWTVVYLISIVLIGAILPFFINTSAYETLSILRDHTPPAIALVAFSLIYSGSHKLRTLANFSTWQGITPAILFGFIIFSAAFVWIFAISPATPGTENIRNSLTILPHSILLFTLILPYLIAWFLGLLAGVNIIKYAQRVKGIIYRYALRDLVIGIAAVVSFAVVLQLFTFSTRYFAGLQLAPLLIVVYVLLLLYALGFLFINSGAKKLTRIEMAQ